MGMWTITIEGVGAHHNPENPKDADKMAREFVARLQESGHYVEHATFTYGGRENAKEKIDG